MLPTYIPSVLFCVLLVVYHQPAVSGADLDFSGLNDLLTTTITDVQEPTIEIFTDTALAIQFILLEAFWTMKDQVVDPEIQKVQTGLQAFANGLVTQIQAQIQDQVSNAVVAKVTSAMSVCCAMNKLGGGGTGGLSLPAGVKIPS